MSKHAETVRQCAYDLSLNRGIPSGDLHAAADYIEKLESIIEDGVRMLSEESGWGTYSRMEGWRLYEERDDWLASVEAARKEGE